MRGLDTTSYRQIDWENNVVKLWLNSIWFKLWSSNFWSFNTWQCDWGNLLFLETKKTKVGILVFFRFLKSLKNLGFNVVSSAKHSVIIKTGRTVYNQRLLTPPRCVHAATVKCNRWTDIKTGLHGFDWHLVTNQLIKGMTNWVPHSRAVLVGAFEWSMIVTSRHDLIAIMIATSGPLFYQTVAVEHLLLILHT